MLGVVRNVLAALGIDTRAVYQHMSAASIGAAIVEQGLAPLIKSTRELVPDLRDQYTAGLDETEYRRYWEIKLRGLHAWQTRCAIDALKHIDGDGLVLADIGDSSGHHAAYIKALAPPGKVDRVVSVNLDPAAVEKVRARGGEAVLCRAEELDLEGLRPDLFISFETVEHLTDPIRFLHALASKGSAEHLLMTIPFRRKSRFGGVEVRTPAEQLPERMTAEEVHIFEFSPEDWRLLARFAGYRPVFERTYYQYPRLGRLRSMAPLWRKLDFEGFHAFFFVRDLSLAERYADW